MIGRLLRNDDVLRLIVLVVLVIVFGLLTNGVTYSPLGLRNILQQSAIVGIAAIGQAFVILTGAIDVSLYGTGMLVSVVGASALTSSIRPQPVRRRSKLDLDRRRHHVGGRRVGGGREWRPCGLGADTFSGRYLGNLADRRRPCSAHWRRRTTITDLTPELRRFRAIVDRWDSDSDRRDARPVPPRGVCSHTIPPSGDRFTRSVGTRASAYLSRHQGRSVSSLRCL